VKTKYNIGDLVWVFYQQWPKEREMAVIIGQRIGTNSQQSEYQVNFIHNSGSMAWFPKGCIEKMKAQPKE